MASTVFQDYNPQTPIVSSWLNDVNSATYINTVDAKVYGASGGGVLDDTAALQAGLNFAGHTGGRFYLPPGQYLYTNLTVPAGVSIVGASNFSSVLMGTTASSGLLFNDACQVINVQFNAKVPQSGGITVNVQGNGCLIADCRFVGYYIGVSVGTFPTVLPVGTNIRDNNFNTPSVSAGSGAIEGLHYSNLIVKNNVITGVAGTQPDFGIRLQNGDTCFLTDNNVTLHGLALYMPVPAGQNNFALRVSGCLFDSAGTITGGMHADCALLNPQGSIQNAKFTACWFGLAALGNGLNLAPTGAGTVAGAEFADCQFHGNNQHGMVVSSAGVSDWVVTGGTADFNGGSGITVVGASLRFSITGFRAGNLVGDGGNAFGINIIPTSNAGSFTITGCHLIGNNVGSLFDGSGDTLKSIKGNLGYNPLPEAAQPVGASPVSYKNTTGDTEMFAVTGGTITSIALNGVTIATSTDHVIGVPASGILTITYSSPPTVTAWGA